MISVQERIDRYPLTKDGRVPYSSIRSDWVAPAVHDFFKVTALFFGVIATIGLAGGLRHRLKLVAIEFAENISLIAVCSYRILFGDNSATTPTPSV